jgi:flagellar biosynthesis protein FlhG
MSYSTRFFNSATPQISTGKLHSRVIAVASGKGGVGKTNVTINLALSLARRGIRVAIFDADMGTANVDLVLGLQPRYHLHHVVTGQKTLMEILVEGPNGLLVIPGASGLPDLADLPEAQREVLLRTLLTLDGMVDLLLIDTSAGVGRSVVQFILAAGELLLVTTPEPTAITDAYALIKVLAGYDIPISINLVVNGEQRRGEGTVTGHKLTAVIEHFLGRHVELIGVIPYDKSVSEAVRGQSPLLLSYPNAPAANAINDLSNKLWGGDKPDHVVWGIKSFLNHILSMESVIKPL